MYFLRTIGIGDVLRALKRREPRVALRIGQNLVSNAVGTARTYLPRRSRLPVRRAARWEP